MDGGVDGGAVLALRKGKVVAVWRHKNGGISLARVTRLARVAAAFMAR